MYPVRSWKTQSNVVENVVLTALLTDKVSLVQIRSPKRNDDGETCFGMRDVVALTSCFGRIHNDSHGSPN